MRLWRLCRARHAELNGIGAAINGGRWNSVGLPLVYMSDSASLCVLEVRVNNPKYIAESYVFVTVDLSPKLVVKVEDVASMPSGWKEDRTWSTSIGHRFVRDQWAIGLSVPSSVVPEGRNVLLNPHHPQFDLVVIHPPRRFDWDKRLWSSVASN